jgi:hypothetical protein
MTNTHPLQQLLRTMQSSRSTLAHDLTRAVGTTGSRSPSWMPLLRRFGVPVGIALGTIAILRMQEGRCRNG